MYRVTVSHAGERLNIKLAGFFDMNSAYNTLREIERIMPVLKETFDVVVDIRHVKEVTDEVAGTIKNGTVILADHGARNIVRVVGSSEYAVTLFATRSWSSPKAKISFVPTLHDADVKLEELKVLREEAEKGDENKEDEDVVSKLKARLANL